MILSHIFHSAVGMVQTGDACGTSRKASSKYAQSFVTHAERTYELLELVHEYLKEGPKTAERLV